MYIEPILHTDALQISDLTYKIVAISEISNTDECVDWAQEMIFLGHDTPSLLTLAGFSKPTNYFEVIDYLPTVLSSLNLSPKVGDEAILSHCSYYIRKIANSDNVRGILKYLYEFRQVKDFEQPIFHFYLLHWAWQDIDYDDGYPTHYWENANKDNIKNIVVETARKWLLEHEHLYALPINSRR